MKIEICCYSIEDAVLAEKAGADRIELCANRELDGISPSRECIIEVLKQISIPIYIMVRPRGGKFIYNEEEINWMCEEMTWAADNKVSGFVFGCLDTENKIDITNCQTLITASNGFPCTFHRAFDIIENKFEALEQLADLGFKRILTSGGVGNAADYINNLKDLITYTKDNIIIMPGGGVRPNYILQIVNETCASEIHSSDRNVLNII